MAEELSQSSPPNARPDQRPPSRSPFSIRLIDRDVLPSIPPLPTQTSPWVSDRGPLVELGLPNQTVRFLWGQPDHLGSAAFWAWLAAHRPAPIFGQTTLETEVASCLLGGYGVTAELASAAYQPLADRNWGWAKGMLAAVADIEQSLSRPLTLPRAGPVSPLSLSAAQRAVRLHQALAFLAGAYPPDDPLELRDWLMRGPGIGPKTASWITRNLSATDRVARIDVHVRRAGISAGFFRANWRLRHRTIICLNSVFLAVARLGGVGRGIASTSASGNASSGRWVVRVVQ